jgi:murein L,D-transpeptidase YcbB/YkuD
VQVTRIFPVYVTYFTMGLDINGALQTFGDIYERDAPVLPASRHRARRRPRNGSARSQ